MLWSDFYDYFTDWSESTLRSRISALKEMGNGDEVVDAVLKLPTEKLKTQLIRKAMRYNVSFSHDDFMSLEGEFPDEVYRELANYAGFDASCPDVDPKHITWWDFYNYFSDWSEDDILHRMDQLEDIGTGFEVSDAVTDLPTEKLRVKLIRKAMQNNVSFTHDDFMNLDGELPDEVYRELAKYTGFDASCPELNPNNLTWDIFYSESYGWSEADMPKRIEQLKTFGSADEVCEIVCEMPNWDCQDALYQKAVQNGVKFSRDQLEDMGKYNGAPEDDWEAIFLVDDDTFNENMVQLEKDIDILCDSLDELYQPKPKKKGLGFWGWLGVAALAFLGSGSSKKDSGHCDGDCANCPPHFGYRYGRWYYGHGHRHGCTRGGNGGI